MVFIRPTILRNRNDAAAHTSAKYRDVQELQRQMSQNEVRLMRNEQQPTVPPFPEAATQPPEGAAPGAPAQPAGAVEQPNGGDPR
jgi:general secretion pathway protein D